MAFWLALSDSNETGGGKALRPAYPNAIQRFGLESLFIVDKFDRPKTNFSYMNCE